MKSLKPSMGLLAITISVFCGTVFPGKITGQELEAYHIYDSKGHAVNFGDMVKQLQKQDVVFFGELHNNPICHWLQYELTKEMIASEKPVILGAEMFETDDQVVLDEYLRETIKLDHLKKEAKMWTNFETDYLPLVDLAKEHHLPFIATNVPRRYASLVSRKGPDALDSLDAAAKSFIGRLPYTVTENDSGYANMKKEMGGHGAGMNIDWLVAAQALKDHTMAENIAGHLQEGSVFVHYNGTFHSQKHAGICHYLEKLRPGIQIGVIASVEADDVEFDKSWKNLGDYILVVPSAMTKTH